MENCCNAGDETDDDTDHLHCLEANVEEIDVEEEAVNYAEVHHELYSGWTHYLEQMSYDGLANNVEDGNCENFSINFPGIIDKETFLSC